MMMIYFLLILLAPFQLIQAEDLECDSSGRLVGKCVYQKLNNLVDGVKFQSCGCCGYSRGGAASYGYGDAEANAKAMNDGTDYNGPTIGHSDPTVSTEHSIMLPLLISLSHL